MISPAPVIASLLPDSPFGEQSIRVLLDRHALEGGNRDDSDLRRRVSFGLPQPRFQETDGGVVEDRCKVVDVATCALGNEAANEHSRATRPGRPVALRAYLSAASPASAPELQMNACAPPKCVDKRSASAAIGSVQYRLDVCQSLSSCSCAAASGAG